MMVLRYYENKQNGKRVAFPNKGYNADLRSDIRFRRRVKFACKHVVFKLFGTLTYAEEFLPFSSRHVSTFFNRWKTLERVSGSKGCLEYIWRQDFGSLTGRPHYHFLATDTVGHAVAARQWGRGFVWLDRVYSINDVSRYVGKYMTKTRQKAGKFLPRRRYGASQGIPKTPPSDYRFLGFLREENYKIEVLDWNQKLGHLDGYMAK